MTYEEARMMDPMEMDKARNRIRLEGVSIGTKGYWAKMSDGVDQFQVDGTLYRDKSKETG